MLLELVIFEMSETLIVASVCRKILFGKSAQTYFRLHSAWGSQIERNSTSNFCKGLFTWREEDPSARKILEGRSS